ncbi:tetratricopeptide repeat protein [Hymenobacter sp. H14-R3]|uniref:tetratricopeptide repeat protein n=1 Tax=Hymenobacter sp. H14-R3 TaxID=3046308 RepID=UPI0024BA7679|nr:tetratricopeptide repeat protein [Hymenobacter sp. H14-R3]MDJ0365653.1 tetratricopeptide repeat protein [Hymenobacter sp. H14-R3]
MRSFAVNILILSLLAGGSQAQGLAPGAGSPPDSAALRKPVKLSRKERRELAQRVEIEAKKVAARPPLSAKEREMSESLYTDGVKYVILEDYPKALERLLKAYTLMPENAAVNYKLAEANLLSGNLRDATGYAEAAVKLDAKNPYYYLLLAQSQASQKQYEAATATYASLVKEVPNSGSYLFQLADLYLAQNKLPEALATLEKAQTQFGSLDEIAFKKQQIYLRQNNLPLALKEGENLIAANPTEPRFVVAQAEMYAANNRLPDAIRVAEQALRLEPNNPQARLILADVYRQQNQPTEVEKQLRLAFDSPALDIDQAVRILAGYIKQLPDPKVAPLALDLATATVRNHPREAKAYSVAGDVEMQTGRKKEARNTYLKALKYDKSKFQLWQQVVLLDAELSQTDSLLVHSDAALELFPNQAPLWFYNGMGHLLKKQPREAVQALEHGRRLAVGNAEQQTQFDSQLGDAYQEMKDYAKSDAAYDAVLAADPNNYGVLNNYSYYLSLRGEKLDKAKDMAGRTVKQFPDNDTYLDTYAWVLYKQKDYAGAKLNLERALKTTKDASILEHYGDVLWQLGERTGAVAAWQRARKAGPGTSALLDRKIKEQKLYE